MHLRSLAILLLCSLAAGQAAPSASPKKAEPPAGASATGNKSGKVASSEAVAPNAAVITIEGVCDTPAATKAAAAAKPKAACKTVITRAQFEELASALQPNMNPAMRKRLADVYPKMLVMAHEARKRGLENDPKYKQVVQFAKMQILSQELSKSLKEEADKVPDAEIQKYYKDNAVAFQQADLKRLFVPKDKQSESGDSDAEEADESQAEQKPTTPAKADQKSEQAKAAEAQNSAEQKKGDAEAKKKADEEAMKKEADAVRARAAAGEDFDKLQKEAFETANIKGTPPSTSIGKLTKNEVPVNHRAALDLAPGQVSEIISEANGYYIYKVVGKDTKPLEQAREQIRATLAQQKMQDAVQKIQDEAKTTLNDNYFAAAPAMPGMQGMPAMGSGNPAAGAAGGTKAPNAPASGGASAGSPAKPAESGQTAPNAPPAPHN
jgi:parvulin-like peptidyl-prolyl isomerase